MHLPCDLYAIQQTSAILLASSANELAVWAYELLNIKDETNI